MSGKIQELSNWQPAPRETSSACKCVQLRYELLHCRRGRQALAIVTKSVIKREGREGGMLIIRLKL